MSDAAASTPNCAGLLRFGAAAVLDGGSALGSNFGLSAGRPLAGTRRGQVAQLVEQRIENPRVDGSIPSLATTSKFLICMRFRASPADYPGPILARFWADPRTIGNCAIRVPRGGRRGWRSGNLGGWRPAGRGRRGAPAGPDVAPEWARVRRAGAGHDDPHGAARRGGGGEREVSSKRPREFQSMWLCGEAARRAHGVRRIFLHSIRFLSAEISSLRDLLLDVR